MPWIPAGASLLFLLLLVLTEAAGAGQIGVDGARMWSGPEYTRFVVDVEGPIQHKVFSLENPDRLVVDLIDAQLEARLPTPAADDQVISRLRSGIREGDDLRIVLDLKQPVRVKSFNLGPNEEYGHRLVIDLSPKGAPAATARAAPSSRGATRPAPAGEADKASSTAATAAAISEGNAHLSIRSQRPANRDLVIAVDAGHGGKDPGAIGAAGTREKDITLAISRKLAKRINARPGMRAVLVRDGDHYIRLRQRIEIARQHRADLFVSIHADAFKDPRVRGSSVFTLSSGGATSEAARWLAERENRADLIGGVDLKQRDDLLASVLIEMSQNATIELSSIAATKVLAKLQRLGDVHQQRIQQAGFAVLKSPDIPSMLVETAFISNPDEEKRLRDSRFQDRLADAILEGIIDYFAEYPPPGTRFARSSTEHLSMATTSSAAQHRVKTGDTLSEIAQSYNVSLSQLRDTNQIRGDQVRVGQVLVIPGS